MNLRACLQIPQRFLTEVAQLLGIFLSPTSVRMRGRHIWLRRQTKTNMEYIIVLPSLRVLPRKHEAKSPNVAFVPDAASNVHAYKPTTASDECQ